MSATHQLLIALGGATANPFVPVFFNPSDKGANITLSNSDRTCGNSAGVWAMVRTTASKSSGKWYAEAAYNFSLSSQCGVFGVCTAAHTLTNFLGSAATGWGLQGTNGTNRRTFLAGVIANAGTSIVSGGSGKCAIDIDAGNGWLGTVGVAGWIGGGDPALGTSPTFTFTPGSTMFFAASAFSTGGGTVTLPSSAYLDPIPSGFAGFG